MASLLFIYLWVPLLQQGLDDWTNNYNNYKQRWDPKSMLPTRCSAEWCYKYPAEVGGEQGLIRVPQNAVEALEEEFYPEAAEMMDTSPNGSRNLSRSCRLEWICQYLRLTSTTFGIHSHYFSNPSKIMIPPGWMTPQMSHHKPLPSVLPEI